MKLQGKTTAKRLNECIYKIYKYKLQIKSLNFNSFTRERLLWNINKIVWRYFAPNLSGSFIKTVKITVTNEYESDT